LEGGEEQTKPTGAVCIFKFPFVDCGTHYAPLPEDCKPDFKARSTFGFTRLKSFFPSLRLETSTAFDVTKGQGCMVQPKQTTESNPMNWKTSNNQHRTSNIQ
jgi:hypothetical protein